MLSIPGQSLHEIQGTGDDMRVSILHISLATSAHGADLSLATHACFLKAFQLQGRVRCSGGLHAAIASIQSSTL